MTSITDAIRADAATSDADGRDLAGHLADFRAALLDEAALLAASDRASHAREVATLTATRDIVIGQRETAQRERDEARSLLHALTADLNATRERLTTAEAHCNSFQHERDMVIANRAGLVVAHDAVAKERDALRAEVADLFTAAVAVAQALDDGRSLGPAGEERDPRAWIRFARELADRVKAIRAEVDKLRARPALTAERLTEAWCAAGSITGTPFPNLVAEHVAAPHYPPMPGTGDPRDPARIDSILARLRAAWHLRPDLRLGQLLAGSLANRGQADRFSQIFNAECHEFGVDGAPVEWPAPSTTQPPPALDLDALAEAERAMTAGPWSLDPTDRAAIARAISDATDATRADLAVAVHELGELTRAFHVANDAIGEVCRLVGAESTPGAADVAGNDASTKHDAVAKVRALVEGSQPATVGGLLSTAPRCSCTSEAGDSRCDAHPSCSECGDQTARNVDDCAAHATRGDLPQNGG